MMYSLQITLSARLEEQQAYDYYEDISEGLGERFLQELEARYEAIRQHPEYYSFIDDRKILRDVTLKRFPFVIIFRILDDKVYVLSVFNTYQLPRTWG